MARKSRTAVLKRQREAKKAEKAQHKRDKRAAREILATDSGGEPQVASRDDLAGYGFEEEEEAVEDDAGEA